MADEPTNLMLEQLRRIDRKVDGVLDEVRHLNLRMGSVERIMSGHFASDVDQNLEIDRIKDRLVRIERRLELTEG